LSAYPYLEDADIDIAAAWSVGGRGDQGIGGLPGLILLRSGNYSEA